MSDDTNGATSAEGKTTKAKPEVTKVTMEDGREVSFTGKRNLNKDYKIDAGEGTVTASFDFRNGQSFTFTTGLDDVEMLLTCAGHGAVQKGGDETSKVKPLANGEPDVDSMAVSVEAVLTRLADTAKSLEDRWYAASEGGDSFSGAAVVVQAVAEARLDILKEAKKAPSDAEVTKVDIDWVKAHLEKKLAEGKAAGLTRQKLYQAYRKPGSKTAIIIARMEQEKLAAATSGVDVEADLAEMVA